jgi:hypothetical protein
MGGATGGWGGIYLLTILESGDSGGHKIFFSHRHLGVSNNENLNYWCVYNIHGIVMVKTITFSIRDRNQ